MTAPATITLAHAPAPAKRAMLAKTSSRTRVEGCVLVAGSEGGVRPRRETRCAVGGGGAEEKRRARAHRAARGPRERTPRVRWSAPRSLGPPVRSFDRSDSPPAPSYPRGDARPRLTPKEESARFRGWWRRCEVSPPVVVTRKRAAGAVFAAPRRRSIRLREERSRWGGSPARHSPWACSR